MGLSRGCCIIRTSGSSREHAVGLEAEALWWCAEACRGGLLFMPLSCFPPPCHVVLSRAHCGCSRPTVLPTLAALFNRAGRFVLAVAVFLPPFVHLTFLCASPPLFFCSSLSSRTMQTLLMRSRPAALRPVRKK